MQKRTKYILGAVTFIVLVVTVGWIFLPTNPKPTGQQKLPTVGKKIVPVITDQEASNYTLTTITPVIEKNVNDPNTVPGIRSRLIYLSSAVHARKVQYAAMSGYSTGNRDAIAHLDYNTETHVPVIMLFLPAIQDVEKVVSKEEFENTLLIAVAHEVIHLQQAEAGEGMPLSERLARTDQVYMRAAAEDEAKAWAVTIIEMIRPMLAQGKKLPANFSYNSEALKQYGDNYKDERWVQFFVTNNMF